MTVHFTEPVFPTWEEFVNDTGENVDEKGNRSFSQANKKYIDAFNLGNKKNELYVVYMSNKNKHFIECKFDVRGSLFKEVYYPSPEFENSETGYKQACEWLLKMREAFIKDLGGTEGESDESIKRC